MPLLSVLILYTTVFLMEAFAVCIGYSNEGKLIYSLDKKGRESIEVYFMEY